MTRLTGIGVSPGIACGRAVVFIHRDRVLQYRVPDSGVAAELVRLKDACALTRRQLEHLRATVSRGRGRDLAALFDAQLLMLDDPLLVPRATQLIAEQSTNADWAVQQAFLEFSAIFEEIEDPYLRERKGDVADLVGRLQMNLRQGRSSVRDVLAGLDDESILVADELPASVAAQVDWGRVRGFVTDVGSRTYHTAILARSLAVPAVVGLHDASHLVTPGQRILVDGTTGELLLDPEPSAVSAALRAREPKHQEAIGGESPTAPGQPSAARTADGVPIVLDANLEFPDDLVHARYAGATGIGLYRSEFLLTSSNGWPDEERQYAAYRALLEGMAPGTVTIRTFDVDEDQLTRTLTGDGERRTWDEGEDRGSRQGLRGLRLSLARPDLFRTQVRALLRASIYGSLRIVFPFVSSVEQVREARRIIEDVSASLARTGLAAPSVPLGAMIEIPAAAYTADLLAREVDFLTIGTNDLIQYCLAVDRADARVSQLYEPFHPAVLRIIRLVRRAAVRHGRRVSVCGEMASDPVALMLLVGLGLTEFSMTPGAIRIARHTLAACRLSDLKTVARRALTLATADAIERQLEESLGRAPA